MDNYTAVIQKLNRALSEKNKDAVLDVSKEFLLDKQNAANAIKKHYNQVVYNIDNGGAGIQKYLEHSIIRELFQNIIDCDYPVDENISITISFCDTTKAIKFKYNENGFKISNVVSFFSLDHTSKDSNNTGAFGIGAKGAILNAKSARVKSWYSCDTQPLATDFTIKTKEQSGKNTLEITELMLLDNTEKNNGTELTITLNDDLYKKIKANLLDITGDKNGKGRYITPLDLAFASLKKVDKRIEIFIQQNVYSVGYSDDKVTFKLGEVGASFTVYTGAESGFSYLIPSLRHGDDMPKFIKEFTYNYFSTYELTGALENIDLPKFYINIPTVDKKCEDNVDTKYYITNDRKGIADNKKWQVEANIKSDCKAMIEKFRDEFFFTKKSESSYMLEHFYQFIKHKKFDDLKTSICKNVRIKINEKTVPLDSVKFYQSDSSQEELAKYIKNNYFCFVTKFHGKISEYSKFIAFNYGFDFTLNPLEAEFTICQYKEYESRCVCYVEKLILVDMLDQFTIRHPAEISLISAENDAKFTEYTLVKLLEAIKKNKNLFVGFENTEITVGSKSYEFCDDFSVQKLSTVSAAIAANKEFQGFIIEIFKQTLFKNKDDLSVLERIATYKEYCELKDYSPNILSFSYNEDNRLVVSNNTAIIDTLDVQGIDYSLLVSATGVSNFHLLKDSEFDDNFAWGDNIADKYGFDAEKISQYSGKEIFLTKISLCNTTYNLGDENLAIAILENKIVSIDVFSKFSYKGDYDDIAIVAKKNKDNSHSKISIGAISEFLDRHFDTGKLILSLYKIVDKPIIKLLDQFDYRMKPILPIDSDEFEALDKFLSINSANLRFAFAKDCNSKLYGYSTVCSVCGYHSEILNAFQLKEKLNYTENGKSYSLSLFLCANDYFESEGWVIRKLTFKDCSGNYAISFLDWLNDIKTNEKSISANLLQCSITISKKISFKLFQIYDEDLQATSYEENKIILTPLMATKWYNDNIK